MIGIDFDNTIVCYDRLFARAGVELGFLPAAFEGDKNAVKQFLQQAGRGDDWTRLQGYVYGRYIDHALPFDGVVDFLTACRRAQIPAVVISHRTRRPYLGPEIDLHAAAQRWLDAHLGEAPPRAYFEETKEAKLMRIRQLGCRWFVDDLPEFLAELDFPEEVGRILFDPQGRLDDKTFTYSRAASWREIAEMLL